MNVVVDMSCVVVAVVWALRAFYRHGESSAVTHGWCLVQRGQVAISSALAEDMHVDGRLFMP